MKQETSTEERHEAQRALPEAPAQKLLPARRRRSFAWLWILLLGGLSYAAYRYYEQTVKGKEAAATATAQRTAPRAVPVVIATAQTGDLPVYLRGLGTVAASNSAAVKSRVDGQLIAIHFQEGEFVKQGTPLAEIDPRPFQVQLEQAAGQSARDLAQLNDAKVNLARYQSLYEKNVIAKQQLDTAAALVHQNEGTIEADKAAIDNAKLQLTYAHITAPISGRVGLRQVDAGNIVHASDPNGIVSISQMQPISVFFTISADSLPAVLAKLRAHARLRVDAFDRSDENKIASGTLLTLDNQIDPSSGTSRLKAVFDNSANELFPNQFVNCRLLIDTQHNAVLVPTAAIQRGPQGTYVFAVSSKGTAKMRVVTTGITEGGTISITQGLGPGEVVVTDGQDKLQDGMKVQSRGAGGGDGSSGGPGGMRQGGSSRRGNSGGGRPGSGGPQNGSPGGRGSNQ